MAEWSDLNSELALWDRPASLWWRDDDAVAVTPQLERLIALGAEYQVPLHLATIPAKVDATLIGRLQGEGLVWVCQHGFDHHNNALPGQRKIELGGRPELKDLLERLKSGRKRLQTAFTGQFLDMLVPPWNRIDRELLSALPQTAYQRLSVLGPRRHKESELTQVNVHVDIIDWKARTFVGQAVALERIIDHLRARRTRQVDDSEPTGIMTHHLVQDEACWEFLKDFFTYVRAQAGLYWLGGHQLLTS